MISAIVYFAIALWVLTKVEEEQTVNPPNETVGP